MTDVLTLAYFAVSFAFITGPVLYLTWRSLDDEDGGQAVGS